ncbi:hypothetical protein [Erwinia sp. 198]|uniref:hypothetical protein n=1 Tax=Erwinia sp. 198 TaxID=2022746 RepID=UPI000F67AF33|nr:hypothetical protein [Erwinia sp. 198]
MYAPSAWNEQLSELHATGVRGHVFTWHPGWLHGFQSRDWHGNQDLIQLCQLGYVIYAGRTCQDLKPMRMHVRSGSESRQALDVLSLTLVANNNYNIDSDYPF